ncbi:MAG: DUF4112 domain-containing protein [Pseudomonadota bacterium]
MTDDKSFQKIPDKEIQELEKLALWMDNCFRIPGTEMRFGFDALAGLIPGIGDTATLATTIYLISKAHKFGVPHHIKIIMFFNLLIDWIVGLVPLIGDIFDFAFKANQKNVDLIKKYNQDLSSHDTI